MLQLTGKHNYSRLAEGLPDPKVMDGVDYVADTYPFTSQRSGSRRTTCSTSASSKALMPAVSVSTGAGTVTTTGWPNTGSVKP